LASGCGSGGFTELVLIGVTGGDDEMLEMLTYGILLRWYVEAEANVS
jgi:hypothetical protein